MTTKLWAKLAGGVLVAALAIGAAPIADAVESPPSRALATRPMAAESTIPSPSVRVSGVLTTRQGQPVVHFELHFQGRINPDIYTIHTRAGGAFSIALPPGIYDLRGEQGEIIAPKVNVARQAVNLGNVETPAPLAPTRLFDRQAIGEAIVNSPAPAAARVHPGGPLAPVAVIAAPHPIVQGTPEGKAMAPAQVVPAGVSKQVQLPPGIKPTIGAPPAAGEMGAPAGGQPSQMTPKTE